MSVRRDSRTGRWFFRSRVTFQDGKRDRIFGTPGVSGPFHDLPNTKLGAQEAERRAIAKAMTGQAIRVDPPKEVPTIKDYVDPFLDGYSAGHKASTKRDKRQRLDAYILPIVGDIELDALRQHHVDSIVADMLDDECSRKHVNNTTSVLSSLVKYAVKNQVITDPRLTFQISAQSARLDFVASENVTKLGAAADVRYRVAVFLAADAGLRIGEIRALPWLEVNELGREVSVAWSYDRNGVLSETKGYERRTVPLSERLWLAMRDIDRAGPLVFARLDGRPIGYDAVRDVAHEIYERAGVGKPMKPWHSLRHTFGTELAAGGADIQTIRELMGHKSIETTMRYLHTTRDRKRAAIARLVPAGSQRAAEQKPTTK